MRDHRQEELFACRTDRLEWTLRPLSCVAAYLKSARKYRCRVRDVQLKAIGDPWD